MGGRKKGKSSKQVSTSDGRRGCDEIYEFDGDFSSISSNPRPLLSLVLVQRAAGLVDAVAGCLALLARSTCPIESPWSHPHRIMEAWDGLHFYM